MTGLLIGEVFRSAARAVPHRVAALVGDHALTFAELDAAADRTAGHLSGHGVRRGDRVVCPAGASPETLAAFAGAARAGAVFVPVDPGAGEARLAEVVRAVGPRLVLADAAGATTGARLAAGAAVRLLVLTDVLHGLPDGPQGAPEKHPRPGEPPPREDDPCVIVVTDSGARGVVLSHRVCVLRTHSGCRPEPCTVLVCGFSPGQWSAWAALLRQWQARGTAVLLERPDPVAVCAAVRGHRAERLVCAPGTWRGVLDTAPHHLATLRFADVEASGRPAEPGLLEDIRTATPHARVRAFLTSPETGDVAVLDHADVRLRPDSCGLPAPGTEVRVAAGELWVRGPLLFDGYADGHANGTREGWFPTGRPAAADDDGHLYVGEN
ncbi:AMP-binding protein [Streptomyces flavofungini]|uniref:AMP-binding protein n=1 Tax=Streptomyces flavofungini TaxID=68200 RepID=UPI0025B1D338|nr:class I adenylate-forming enzyme family protein [Streptomyces flavofungini]WJV49501.1 class I adenylate-forming enzyme family protein [Streptomyces flavofungini]